MEKSSKGMLCIWQFQVQGVRGSLTVSLSNYIVCFTGFTTSSVVVFLRGKKKPHKTQQFTTFSSSRCVHQMFIGKNIFTKNEILWSSKNFYYVSLCTKHLFLKHCGHISIKVVMLYIHNMMCLSLLSVRISPQVILGTVEFLIVYPALYFWWHPGTVI